jgi:hypothetical protein
VPLNIGIYFGKSGKIRAYIKPGITFSFVSNATSKVEGKIKYYGYYPIPNWKNKPYYFEDTRLGFYNYETNKESDIKSFVAPTIISISISGGINIPFDNHISLSIDGFYKYGITNLIPNQKQYIDLFGKTEINQSSIPTHVFDYKKVSILNYGISVGLNYNF